MTVDILFAIITCNRINYARNCLQSLLEFVDLDGGRVMLIDNCSKESGSNDFFGGVPKDIIVHRFTDRVPNELYRAMNFAIKYCLNNSIPIVNFIQDDYQYLFKIPNLIRDIHNLFSEHRFLVQVQTNLIWKRKSPGEFDGLSYRKINYAVLRDKIACDSGFTRVSTYKQTGFYPEGVISYDQDSANTFGFGKNRYKKTPNGELWFGNKCKKLGLRRAISFYPNMGMMYDCAYVRDNLRFGRYFPPPEKYYMKTFDEAERRIIAKRNKKQKFSYIEEMVLPWGWKPTTFDKHNREGIKSSII